MAAIKVMIADDHSMFREGLRSLLEQERNIHLLADATNGQSVIEQVAAHEPDVVVMDLNMPGVNGIDATRQILEQAPKTKVIILSVRCDKQIVGDALRAGASGYIPKDSSYKELAMAIHTVAQGRVHLSPVVAAMVVDGYVRQTPDEAARVAKTLTTRERQVLQLVAEGKTTKEIAAAMMLSAKTVDTHRQQIMIRLNLHSVAELTKFAIREGLTNLES